MTSVTIESLDSQVKIATTWTVLSGVGAAITLHSAATSLDEAIFVFSALACGSAYALIRAVALGRRRNTYKNLDSALSALKYENDPTVIRREFGGLRSNAHDPLLARLIYFHCPAIEKQLKAAEEKLTKKRRRKKLRYRLVTMRESAIARVARARATHPKLVARDATIQNLERVKARREQLEADVDQLLEGASWWQKLNYDYPNYAKMDRDIQSLESSVKYFLSVNAQVIQAAEVKFEKAEKRVLERLKTVEANVISAIPNSRDISCDEDALARHALLLGALSIPVSAWNDVAQANEVYDVLRSVNGTYAEMSDFEIWLQCLTIPSESLAGLMSLTKGALFEAHVADSTGGILHTHFNTPDTDIVIDGMAFQIKATDSESYIESVDPVIPVITTSEVAETTGAIDGGISNAELDTATSLAMGGTVIDASDTVVDAAISGLGGLGILATISGINHAIAQHREGIDKAEAIEEGVGVAVTGSIKATVDIAEMGYKVATSRPSRFVGRQLLKVINRIDRSLDDEEDVTGTSTTSRPPR